MLSQKLPETQNRTNPLRRSRWAFMARAMWACARATRTIGMCGYTTVPKTDVLVLLFSLRYFENFFVTSKFNFPLCKKNVKYPRRNTGSEQSLPSEAINRLIPPIDRLRGSGEIDLSPIARLALAARKHNESCPEAQNLGVYTATVQTPIWTCIITT